MTEARPEGPRERRKARTKAAIQDAALRLYLEHGYHATTVDQVAEAADVSPATFFRHFATKEDSVLYDRLDPVFIEVFLRQPAELSPLAALRAAFHEVFAEIPAEAIELEKARMQLVAHEPKLRSAAANQLEAPMGMFVAAVAERVGRDPADLAIVCWAGAVVGALYAGMLRSLDESSQDLFDLVDQSFEYLEKGLPL